MHVFLGAGCVWTDYVEEVFQVSDRGRRHEATGGTGV
jgi:hypothetical protein